MLICDFLIAVCQWRIVDCFPLFFHFSFEIAKLQNLMALYFTFNLLKTASKKRNSVVGEFFIFPLTEKRKKGKHRCRSGD